MNRPSPAIQKSARSKKAGASKKPIAAPTMSWVKQVMDLKAEFDQVADEIRNNSRQKTV